uniref:Major pollen allergen Ole e 6-like n=1 Tax=Nelumbo nucifera TaxID=4432 RepID=A0A823A166_NELNU|nr:TPA_asm: hypothetical protein HUJ06_017845 [Nelumbo nucifera]DAD47909.1 TPA_asm: hypothetical protein HUJ06_017846 [Nelumbo nucifera]
MANKIVAVLVVCMVLFAAVQFSEAADEGADPKYVECLYKCGDDCKGGEEKSACDAKCDQECKDKVKLG